MRYQYKSILIRLIESVAVVKLNTQDDQDASMVDIKRELANFLTRARTDNQIRVIIFIGKGRTFFTGNDLKVQCASGALKECGLNEKHRSLAWIVRNLDKPVIAAVNGYAIGAGMKLALACDIVIASENAKFYEMRKEPEYASRRLDAEGARQAGIVAKVVAEEALLDEALALAQTFARGLDQSFAYVRRLLDKSQEYELRPVLHKQTV